MSIFCTSFFLQFKLNELKRGVFLGVTILNQLPRDINWHTCSHLPFYYSTSEPIKLQFAWFVFIIQQLLLIVHLLPSVWVNRRECPCQCQGPSMKGDPKQISFWLKRPDRREACPLGLGCSLSGFSVCWLEWLWACVSAVAQPLASVKEDSDRSVHSKGSVSCH